MRTAHLLALILAFAADFALLAGDIDPKKIPPAAPAAEFEKDIKPLLEASCVRCHGSEKQKGAFRIDTREGLLKGGRDDRAIVEGDSAKSPMIHYVTRLVEDMEMPPKGKGDALSPAQIGLLRAWIDAGANWPAGVKLVGIEAPAVAVNAAVNPAQLPPAATRKVDFAADIQPIFAGACYECHGPRKQEAEFRLDRS